MEVAEHAGYHAGDSSDGFEEDEADEPFAFGHCLLVLVLAWMDGCCLGTLGESIGERRTYGFVAVMALASLAFLGSSTSCLYPVATSVPHLRSLTILRAILSDQSLVSR